MFKKEKRGWTPKKLVFKVQRYEPIGEEKPHLEEFTVPFTKGMTVLDGLIYIKEEIDNTLAFRTSCRMGICGSCGMLINNFPHLACHTPVEELRKDMLEIKALPNFAIVKDLISDLTPLFEKHKSVQPYILRSDSQEVEEPSGEFSQSPQELEDYEQFAYCIKCGICMAGCPTVATDRLFLGPQPLAQAYRYLADSRDEGGKERLLAVDTAHGVWLCHLAGACSEACPKGVDPALAIQLLRRKVILKTIRLRKEKQPAPLVKPPTEQKPKLPVPEFTAKHSSKRG